MNKDTCGVVNLLKPPGMTSSDAVMDVRRLFGVSKAGHTGTLDPAAAGVLPICVGRATRLCGLFTEKDKRYIGEIVFGAATDTDDAQGVVIQRCSAEVSLGMLEAVLSEFTGSLMQTPPAYSALKVNGERMYALAREGRAFERALRAVEVHMLRVMEQTAENRFLLEIHCGKGTYIRALFRDIGQRLGTLAHMGFLLRTAAGPFTIERSVTLGELQEARQALAQGEGCEALMPVEEAVAYLPRATVEAWRRTPMCNGLTTYRKHVRERELPEHAPLRIYCEDEFLGVGHLDETSLVMDALMVGPPEK